MPETLPSSVLFVDADDVFYNTAQQVLVAKAKGLTSRRHEHAPAPDTIALIVHLARQTGSSIVISSTRRKRGAENAINEYVSFGFPRELFYPTDPCTGDAGNDDKLMEVSEYLSRHPEIKRHVAIDDEYLINRPGIRPMVRSTHVDGNLGFTVYNYNACCDKLGQPHLKQALGSHRPARTRRETRAAIKAAGLS